MVVCFVFFRHINRVCARIGFIVSWVFWSFFEFRDDKKQWGNQLYPPTPTKSLQQFRHRNHLGPPSAGLLCPWWIGQPQVTWRPFFKVEIVKKKNGSRMVACEPKYSALEVGLVVVFKGFWFDVVFFVEAITRISWFATGNQQQCWLFFFCLVHMTLLVWVLWGLDLVSWISLLKMGAGS